MSTGAIFTKSPGFGEYVAWTGDLCQQQWKILLPCVALLYLLAVSLLRYRRLNCMTSKLKYHTRASLSRMTTAEAQAIMIHLSELEFPTVYFYSVAFALFKTYGIPSISHLLTETGQLVSLAKASKRSADTVILITEFIVNSPTSERTINAIARMNFLHSGYQKSGKILDADMLYTLSLFALEPPRWVEKYEWRRLSDMELCALGTFWKSMGDAMSIPFNELPSHVSGWKDGLHWLDEVRDWSLAYETSHMVPAVTNKQLADSTMDILLWYMPSRLMETGKVFASLLMDERLRRAMMYPKPPALYSYVFHLGVHLRKLCLRYLALPRPSFMRFTLASSGPDPSTGRFNTTTYISHPWYVKPTFRNRWGFEAWVTWLVGGTLPGDEGERYIPQGFKVDDVGPKVFESKGIQSMADTQSKLSMAQRGACPFMTV